MPTFFPIIFVHGWGGPSDLYRDFGAADERDPYVGWNTGHRYNDPDGWIKFRNFAPNFEGLVLRLVKDFYYYDASNDELLEHRREFLKQTPPVSPPGPKDAALVKTLWIFRYYEYNAQYLQLSDEVKNTLKKELSDNGYNGPFAGIPYYAALLAAQVQQIARDECAINLMKEPDDAGDAEKLSGLNLGKVALVGHSMGGLISRFAIQYNLFGAAGNVARLMTLATPHGGSRWDSAASLLQFLPAMRDDDMRYFAPDWVKENMGGKDPNGVVADDTGGEKPQWPLKLKNTDVFCLVGTRHADFSKLASLPHTDGIVDQREAYLEGYPYAYAYNTHAGEYGIRENHNGYQALRRFLFGDLYVQLRLTDIKINEKYPRDESNVSKIIDNDKFFFEYYVKPRGINVQLNEISERSENQPRPRALAELQTYLKVRPYIVYDGFADSTALVDHDARAVPGVAENMLNKPHLQLEHSSFRSALGVGAQLVGSGYDMVPLIEGTTSVTIEDQTFTATIEVDVQKRK